MFERLTASELRADLRLLQEWTDEHPEAYAGLILHAYDSEDLAEPEDGEGWIELLVVGAADTPSLGQLRNSLAYPDRLVVRSVAWTYAELDRIVEQTGDDSDAGVWPGHR